MKVSVFGFVVFAVVAILVARGAFAFLQKLVAESAPTPTPTAPSAPRRSRRARPAPAPAPESEGPRPLASPRVEPVLVVTRPARAHARPQFRGAAALRQAIVAREVLGPPLSLRPPRV
jgi:hypothetical protein